MIGPTGSKGPNGFDAPSVDMWDITIFSPDQRLLVPPRTVIGGNASSTPAIGPRGLVIFAKNYPSTAYVHGIGTTLSLRGELPAVNAGPPAYATIGRSFGFVFPTTIFTMFGVCDTGTNYVEFRYYNSSNQSVVMNESNLGSPIELSYSIQYYMSV
jgi:hypothetical protein